MADKEHIILFSGGTSSAVAADLVMREGQSVTVLYTDTDWEDEDNWRFIQDALEYFKSQDYKFTFKHLKDGRNPLQVFEQCNYLGNAQRAICSRELKSAQTYQYLKSINFNAVLYFGIKVTEWHRADSITERYRILGVECRYPLIEKSKELMGSFGDWDIHLARTIVESWGVKVPRMYDLGFKHANCGGRCVRGGEGHWLHLLKTWPDRYKQMEDFEQAHSEGKYTYLTSKSLKTLRLEAEADPTVFKKARTQPCLQCFST